MSYPGHFPANCPPEKSEVASGEFYRFIKMSHKMPLPEDFLSWRQENPTKACPEELSECQACGISIYSSLDDVINAAKRVPRLRKIKVAKGTLNSNLGRIKNTPSRTGKSHHTWWIPENSEPWKEFQIVDLNNESSNA